MKKFKKPSFFLFALMIMFLANSYLESNSLSYAVFRAKSKGKRLTGRNFSHSSWRTPFIHSYPEFNGFDLRKLDLSGSKLPNSTFVKTNLQGALLNNSYLIRSQFVSVDAKDSSFRMARLDNSFFQDVNLRNADLRQADLSTSELFGVDFSGANLEGIKLKGARYNKKTIWPNGFSPEIHNAELDIESN